MVINKFKNVIKKHFKQFISSTLSISLTLVMIIALLVITFIMGIYNDGTPEARALQGIGGESFDNDPAADEYEQVYVPEPDYDIEYIYIEVECDESNQAIDEEEIIIIPEVDDYELILTETVVDHSDTYYECIVQQSAHIVFDEEKTRLYDFLFEAHTYLLTDDRDFIDEYHAVKNQWLGSMSCFDEEAQPQLWEMIEEESWTIDIAFPLEVPFKLSHDEFVLVYFNFTSNNPQFHLNQIVPLTMSCESGLTPHISLPAYYAFAYRR